MKILAFGIVKEIFSSSMITVDLADGMSVDSLTTFLEGQYPQLHQLGSYMIAVNNEYASGSDLIKQSDEIAIIPPVSGG